MLSFEQQSALHHARIGLWAGLAQYDDLNALFPSLDARIGLETVWLVAFRTAVEGSVVTSTNQQIRSCRRVLEMIAGDDGDPVPVTALPVAEIVSYAEIAGVIAAIRSRRIPDTVQIIQSYILSHIAAHDPITLDLRNPLYIVGYAIGIDMALHDAEGGMQRTNAEAEESAWRDYVDGWLHTWLGEEADFIAAVVAGWRGQQIIPRP